MKRKIQHDAVNNQEDEDSSTHPTRIVSDQPFDKKEDKPNENITDFFSDLSIKKDELTSKRKNF